MGKESVMASFVLFMQPLLVTSNFFFLISKEKYIKEEGAKIELKREYKQK